MVIKMTVSWSAYCFMENSMRISYSLLILLFANNPLCAQLSRIEFVEAVAVLKVDPASLSAAGVSESDSVAIWSRISNQASMWDTYQAAKEDVRVILDTAISADNQNEDLMNAQMEFDNLLASWVDELTATLTISQRIALGNIIRQFDLSVPVYLKVCSWTTEQESLLVRGCRELSYAGDSQNQQMSESMLFYDTALAHNLVIIAKANFEARHDQYKDRFQNHLESLSP
jgi:hypothetical protein